MGCGVSVDMSAPTSAIAAVDSALIEFPGFVSAECTSTESPATWRISAAAIWDVARLLKAVADPARLQLLALIKTSTAGES